MPRERSQLRSDLRKGPDVVSLHATNTASPPAIMMSRSSAWPCPKTSAAPATSRRMRSCRPMRGPRRCSPPGAGLDLAILALRLIDPAIEVKVEGPDCGPVEWGDLIATISGPARRMLTAERTALNFLCHLSGIASATAAIVTAIE
jgi:hypothetical protein